MKIRLSSSAGFCFGVSNAISRISRALVRHSPIQIDGDLIHNPNTTAILAYRGLIRKNSSAEFTAEPIAIRTHGATRDIQKTVYAHSKTVFNLTCPKVSRIQSIIKKFSAEGCYTILVGDRHHPEVISLESYATSGISVISSIDDIHDIPAKKSYILISQSTFETSLFNAIQTEIVSRFPSCRVFNTICDSTSSRQDELHQALKNNTDTVVVIGGLHSANTRSLASIARNAGAHTLHTESPASLVPADFSGSKNVFITAGASTPAWSILDTLDRIRSIRLHALSPVILAGFNLFSGLIYSYMLPAASLFLWSFAVCRICSINFNTAYSLSASVLYMLLSLAADFYELPLLLYSDRNRYLFLKNPASFIIHGAVSPDPAGFRMQKGSILPLLLKTTALLPVPAYIYFSSFSLTGLSAALALFGVILMPMLTADALGYQTDIITGRKTSAPYVVIISAAVCAFGFLITAASALNALPPAGYILAVALILSAAVALFSRYAGYTARRRYEKAAVCIHTAASVSLALLLF